MTINQNHMFKTISLLLISLFSVLQLSSQNKEDRKTIKTTRATIAPKIDGVLDDDAWKNAELCTDFVIFRPANGELVSAEYQSIVRVIYDDNAMHRNYLLT